MDHPPRTLMATTGTAISITKTAEDGRRMHRGIRREAAEEKIRRSHPGDEEEPEEHRHHHLEEMEISLVINLDRRVSLMVIEGS